MTQRARRWPTLSISARTTPAANTSALATGTLPFPGHSTGEILEGIFGREPVAPARLNPRVPPRLEEIIAKAMEKDPSLKAAGFSVKGFISDHGFKSIRTKDPLEVMKRIWAMPTFEVHGLVGGYGGPGVKTIVPPRTELKCSIRLVPKMKGEKVVKLIKAFVKKRHPDVRVEGGSSAPPYKGITSGPYVEAAKRSIQFAFGKTPVFVREGGTIGAVLSMEQILKCPIVFMGLSLPDHGYHAPNENYDWGQAGGGIVAFAKFFEEVAQIGARS